MVVKIQTNITADVPTKTSGNIYEFKALDQAVHEFNTRTRAHHIPGGILNRKHIQRVDDVTHVCDELVFDENRKLHAIVNIKNDELIKAYENGVELRAYPVIAIPSSMLDNGNKMITIIQKIIRVQLEVIK